MTRALKMSLAAGAALVALLAWDKRLESRIGGSLQATMNYPDYSARSWPPGRVFTLDASTQVDLGQGLTMEVVSARPSSAVIAVEGNVINRNATPIQGIMIVVTGDTAFGCAHLLSSPAYHSCSAFVSRGEINALIVPSGGAYPFSLALPIVGDTAHYRWRAALLLSRVVPTR